MQIKNIEALKTWLTARLEKICDADPAALAKYVVALIRKDKLLGELEEICIDQLEVFLANSTVSFVKTLFEVLQNNSYIPAPPTPSTPLPEPPQPSNPPKSSAPKPTTTSKPSNIPKAYSAPKPATLPINQPKPNNPSSTSNISTSPKQATKRLLSTDESLRPQAAESSVLDEDDRDFKRTRKPAEDIEEKANLATFRDSHIGYKTKKRRTDVDHDSGNRSKISKDDHSEGISSDGKAKQTNEGPRKKDGSEDRSGDQERSDKQRESSSDHENAQHKIEGSLRGKYDNRFGKNRPYKGRFWGNKRARCRDYEEKGLCMRGELCPFDHGDDPLVVEDVNIPGIVLGFPHSVRPPGFIPERPPLNPAARLQSIRPPMAPIQFPIVPPPPPPTNANVRVTTNPPTDHSNGPRLTGPHLGGPQHVGPTNDEHQAGRAQITNPPGVPLQQYKDIIPNVNDVYNPEQPSFDRGIDKPPVWSRLGMPVPRHPSLVQRNRELLQVLGSQRPTSSSPVPPETISSSTPNTSSAEQVTPSVKTEVPSITRDPEPPVGPAIRKYTNTVLEIKKLPPDKNNISTLNDYFQKFGKIVNIQVSAFGQTDIALIQFSSNAEANKAITCSDAVFGNRFIRVFWYKPDAEKKTPNTRNVADSQVSTQKPVVEKPIPPTMFHSGKTSFKASSVPVVPKKDATSHQVQEMMKKKLLIQKQKQELLGKQIAQQKLLINKLEQHKNMSLKDKEKIMQTLKVVSDNISTLQCEVKVTAALAKSKECPVEARKVAKRELLDRELDLITHEQTGEDTTELRHRVEELKKEAQSLGLLDSSRGRGRARARGTSRGLSRGRARGRTRNVVSRSAAVLDKRPKQLLVEGFSGEEGNLITQRLKEIGDINRIEQNKEPNRLIFTFGTRKQAEAALLLVPTLNIKNLKVTWYRQSSTTPTPSSLKVRVEGEQHPELPVSILDDQEVEDLLLGDFDEEEEEEERSWRR